MRRVFAVDVEQCPKCHGRNTKIEFVTGKEQIDRILKSIGYARAPGQSAEAA